MLGACILAAAAADRADCEAGQRRGKKQDGVHQEKRET